MFFDPGFSVIDGHVEVGVNGYNYLYYMSGGRIFGARSTTLNPGSFNSNTYTSPLGNPIPRSFTEAPIVIKSLASDTWWLWGDSYRPVNGVFFAWQTSDISNNSWTALNKRDYDAPLNCKHATIATITSTEHNNLIAKWGTPEWNRVKSYNFPDRYIRHANNIGRIDAAPFDPTAEMQWKIVPGLADSSGISFQSVISPNCYLRHSNHELVLHANDSSHAFKADATFHKTAGLADSTWTSFKSHSLPSMYIRHSNYVLKLSAVPSSSSAQDQQDATFKIGY